MSDEASSGGLHIDSDWKTEAAEEKKRLVQQEQQEQTQQAAGPQQASFLELINLLAMQAGIALGGYQGPNGENVPANPHAAKHYVDLLEIIQKKTEGNLEDEEKKVLDAVLHELRMIYVQSVSGAATPTPADTPETIS